MENLWNVARYLPLAVATVTTFYAQSVWGKIDFFIDIILHFLWLMLILGWVGKLLYTRWKQYQWKIPLALPVVIGGLAALNVLDLPVRIVWWANRSAFERALSRPDFTPDYASGVARTGPRVGMFRVLQSSKSGNATRFVLKEEAFLTTGTVFGYAYCPSGCSGIKFKPYWLYADWGEKYVPLSKNWYAWTQEGTNMD